MSKTKTVFALNDGVNWNIHSIKLYDKQDLAEDALKQIKKDRRYKPGVTVIIDTPTEFQFIIGWEEHQVTFKILPIEVQQ